MIEFKLVGDWRGAQRALDQLPRQVKTAALWGQEKAARKLVRIVKAHIDTQDLGWEPRAANTNSNDPRTLVDTEAYYNSIKVWRSSGTYFAGVKRSEYDSKGRRISDYAIYHEFGGPNLPRRPLWGPSMVDLGGGRGVRKIVLTAIYNKVKLLRAQGFDINLTGL